MELQCQWLTDIIYLDLCKVMLPHDIMLAKFEKNGFDGWITC